MESEEQDKQLQEEKLKKAFKEFLTSSLLDNISDPAFITSSRVFEDSINTKIENMLTYWRECPQNLHSTMMQIFVEKANNEPSNQYQELLYQVLKTLIQLNIIPSKTVCEYLVANHRMNLHNPNVWQLSLQLITSVIDTFDYKGSRDLLHNLLEKVCKVEKVHARASLDLVTSLVKLIEHLMDRSTCLLPAYFAVNEIEKLSMEGNSGPHWEIRQKLVEYTCSFLPAARIHTILARSSLYPVVGHSVITPSVWRLSSSNLKLNLQGPLPYNKQMTEPQGNLLQYLLRQPYSRDTICTVLGLNKQSKLRCTMLEDQFVQMIIRGLEECPDDEGGGADNDDKADASSSQTGAYNYIWNHTSGQLIFFILFKFTSFSHIVTSLVKELVARNLRKGRDYIMWVLLQFISGSIHNEPLKDFIPVIELCHFLYPETSPLPIPDVTSRLCIHKLAAVCIWVHLTRKANNDKVILRTPLPTPFVDQFEFIHQLALKPQAFFENNNYTMALVCNAYSTNSDYFSQPMAAMMEFVFGTPHSSTSPSSTPSSTPLPRGLLAYAPTFPIRIETLDILTVHAKMSLIHTIYSRLSKFASNDNSAKLMLSPALVETYGRLLIYAEIESLGIKTFIGQLLPTAFKEKCWRLLLTLLELCHYRLNHILPHYRTQLLCQLQSINQVPHNIYQLHLCIENTALHLIDGFSNADFQPQFTRILNEPKYPNFLSSDSEEYNKVFLLALARTIHITGSDLLASPWPREILSSIHKLTPLSWSHHSFSHFPHTFSEFYSTNSVPREDKANLKRNVDNEYRKWKSMAGENDLIKHFSSQHSLPLFICVLWKCLIEDNRLTPIAYKVLDRLGPKALCGQLRSFVDYVVYEVGQVGANNLVNKYIDCLNDLIWKWNVVSLDRFVLTMCLRAFDGNEVMASLFVTQVLLLRPSDFKCRLNDFVCNCSPEHWRLDDYYHKHMAFHNKFPELLYFEQTPELSQQHQLLPVYFSNICLRFIPVLDLLVYRLLEVPQATKFLDLIMEHLGVLYKFHARPVNFLYNTLHYYEKLLKDRAWVKKRLVQVVTDSQKDLKPKNWIISEDYSKYIETSSSAPTSSSSSSSAPATSSSSSSSADGLNSSEKATSDATWIPEIEYYMRKVERLVDAISGKLVSPPSIDWRFNECTNLPNHVLTSTCVELMALPVSCKVVGKALYDVVLKNAYRIARKDYGAWVNAVALISVSMPLPCWSVLNELVYECITKHLCRYNNNVEGGRYFYREEQGTKVFDEPSQLFNFDAAFPVFAEKDAAVLLCLCHSVWSHSKIGVLIHMFNALKEVRGVMEGEMQLLFVCHLVGPFLQRFHIERTRCMMELTIEMYWMLEKVDKNSKELLYIDTICDFLYHIKYMFVGDGVKSEVEKIIKRLRPELQRKLQYISYHSKDEAAVKFAATAATTANKAPPSIQTTSTTVSNQ